MKTILLVIIATLIATECRDSQTLDSVQAKKLRLFIIDCQGAKEQLQSALHEIELSDSALVKQFLTIENLKEMDANNKTFIGELRAEINRMKADKLNWLIPFGGGVLSVAIIWITTLMLSK